MLVCIKDITNVCIKEIKLQLKLQLNKIATKITNGTNYNVEALTAGTVEDDGGARVEVDGGARWRSAKAAAATAEIPTATNGGDGNGGSTSSSWISSSGFGNGEGEGKCALYIRENL